MPKPPSREIRAGREAVGVYRTDHTSLYSGGWYEGISEDHTPLLNTLLIALAEQGFNSLQEFFDASEALEDGWM